MNKLPSGYIAMDCIGDTNQLANKGIYFDSGVLSKSTLKITALFYSSSTATDWVFGVRNTNSSTSAGQINLLNQEGTGRIGYYNALIGLGANSIVGETLMNEEGNLFVFNAQNMYVTEYTGATNSFTGTRNIYILALNNGGTVAYALTSNPRRSIRLKAFKIKDGDTLVRDYAPAYQESTGQFGLYDFANSNFITYNGNGTLGTFYLVEMTHTEGGTAHFVTANAGNVDKVYLDSRSTNNISDTYSFGRIKAVAVADKGYVFDHWEYRGQNYTNEEAYVSAYANGTVHAVFKKEIETAETTGFKLLGLQYGIGNAIYDGTETRVVDQTTPFARFNHFANVMSASVTEDATSSSTTTIECESLSSAFVPNMPVFLMNPRGKVVYGGVIKSVEGNTLTCREAISIFDSDYVLYSRTITHSLIYYVRELIRYFKLGYLTSANMEASSQVITTTSPAVKRMMNPFLINLSLEIPFDIDKAMNYNPPVISSTDIINLKDYLFTLFNSFGVYIRPSLTWTYFFNDPTDNGQGKKYLMKLEVFNPKIYDTITLGNNLECISNLSVDESGQQTTLLTIYNSSGNSLRGIYTVDANGNITEQKEPYEQLVSYNDCKAKAILSDDSLRMLLEQNLSNAQYNHKITFDIDLKNNLLSLDAFKMGRMIDFYVGNKLYRSIVTGIKYDVINNDIQKATVTLGKVRNKLTTKLNLSKQ